MQHEPRHAHDMDGAEMDPDLAAAIEASYYTQMPAGIASSEDDMIAEAMRLSRLEEEASGRVATELESRAPPADTDVSAMDAEDDALMEEVLRMSLEEEEARQRGAGHHPSDASPEATSAHTERRPVGGDGSAEAAAATSDPYGLAEDSEVEMIGETSVADQSPRAFLGGGTPAPGEEAMDPQFAAAIEASYFAQTEHGIQSSEDDLLQEAIRKSALEEEARQRASLRDQQEQELQESLLMDQMREQEEKRKRQEEEEQRAVEASRVASEEESRRKAFEEKSARLPPEPVSTEPGKIDIQVRAPDGRRLRRCFRGTDLVGHVYDYLDIEGGESFTGSQYRLIATMPRRAFEDREMTLAAAGLQGQCALLIERGET